MSPPTFDPDRLRAVAASGLHAAPSDQLDRLTRLASEVAGVPVALISIVDDERQFFASQCGLTGDPAETRQTPLSQSVCATVVDEGRTIVIDDLGADPRYRDHPARRVLGVESYCGVPVIDPDGVVLGSLCLIDQVPHVWTDENVRLLENLSTFVTETISVHQSYVRLVNDAQDRLVPTAMAQPASGTVRGRYRAIPHTSGIGGDFLDARSRPDGGVDIIIGDAVGHGIECATAAAQLRAASIAVLAEPSLEPGDVVARLSTLVGDLPGCDMAALIVARIDPTGSSVTWARAGAMPPVVVTERSPERHDILWEEAINAPLGVIGPDTDVVEGRRAMQPGERIAFFTDGLVQRADDDVTNGLERLNRVLASADDLDDVIVRTCPAHVQIDDIALVVWDVGQSVSDTD